MPVFRHACACGWCGDLLVDHREKGKCPECHGEPERQFSPTTALRLAPYLAREAEDGRARHKLWLETPEVQAKLRSGEFDSDLSDRHCESLEGVGGSSSIADRAAEGLAF